MQRREELVQLLLEHIQMTSAAVLISICIGIPLGIFVTKNKKASSIVIGIANIMQSIPSIGLLAFLVPVVGIGQKPAIIMVIIYALLPIIKNTYIGITGIQQSAIESASSIGLTKWRILYKIQIQEKQVSNLYFSSNSCWNRYHCCFCRCGRSGMADQSGLKCQ